MKNQNFTTLFLDVGGVLLTNGWDHCAREKASKKFGLDLIELNKRHALTFDTYETGKITLDIYLDRVIFYLPRNFSRKELKDFIFSQSQPYLQMLELIRDLKKQHSLRTVVVSNEGREIMEYRIHQFKLKEVIDFFVCSCFIGLRKPDTEVYRLALDLAQVRPQEVIYIDDRVMLTEIGGQLGMQTIQHQTYEQTKKYLLDMLSLTT